MGMTGEDTLPDCVATELFLSAIADIEAEEDDVPLVPTLLLEEPNPSFCCFMNREVMAEEEDDELSPTAVGVVREELGGLWEGFLSEEMSMVGEGRVEMGVSMVDGRGMDGGFTRSSLLTAVPPGTSSVDETGDW